MLETICVQTKKLRLVQNVSYKLFDNELYICIHLLIRHIYIYIYIYIYVCVCVCVYI